MNHKSVYKLKHIMLTIYLQLCHNVLTVIQYYNHKETKKTKTSRKDLKKVGIMRINSYNKFFAKVAEIMNTSIKDVAQLDVGYIVRLANHVNLRVFRGVNGSLFIHDRRRIDNISSCYDFEDFKTIKDLYDRLVLDYGESDSGESAKREVMEVKQALNARFGKEQCFDTDSVQPNETIIAKIENINYCPNQNTCCAVSPFVHCDYNYKSEACIKAHKNFIHYWEQVHKQLKAKHKPEWHNVSLTKLADIDFDRLDEKRHLYLSLYREIKELLKDLHNCKSGRSYEKRLAKMHSRCADLVYENKVTSDYIRYVTRKVSMCNVECGLWTSANEVSTGYHKSRRYNQMTIRY